MSAPRLFRRKDMIELGSGLLAGEQWWLLYDPVGEASRAEDHAPSGPIVWLYVGDSGHGKPLALNPLSGSLGRPALFYRGNTYSTAHVYGKVAFGFDRVQLDCDTGPTVEAIVVECTDYLPYNHYIGEVVSRVIRVSATGTDGQTATMDRDWYEDLAQFAAGWAWALPPHYSQLVSSA